MIAMRNFIFLALIVLALASGLSEPLARNSARIIFFVSAIMFFTDQRVLDQILRRNRLVTLMLAFSAWILISSICAGRLPTHDSSVYWSYFLYNMFLFVPIALFIDREKQIDWIFLALAVSLMLNNIVVEMEALANFERPVTFLRGSYMQSALLYVILLPGFLILTLRSTKPPIKIACWIFFIASLTAFILLKTRGAMLCMLVVLPLVIAFFVRDLKKLLSITLILALTLVAFINLHPSTVERVETVKNLNAEQSVSERFLIWRSTVEMIKDHLIMGVGFGEFEQNYKSKYISDDAKERWQGHAHNTYLQLWAETGVIGLTIYCALFGYILRWSWRRRANHYAAMIFFSTLGFMLYSLTDYTYSSFSAMRVYWFVFGICLRGADLPVDKSAPTL
ncbi:MAG: O-antigen ligase family protein [Selenomonadaceae bacterium]|nr:O-antigen ligase family protein [Selenomonadaceae bacterium]